MDNLTARKARVEQLEHFTIKHKTIFIEHTDSIRSLDSELLFVSIFSIGILNILEVIKVIFKVKNA